MIYSCIPLLTRPPSQKLLFKAYQRPHHFKVQWIFPALPSWLSAGFPKRSLLSFLTLRTRSLWNSLPLALIRSAPSVPVSHWSSITTASWWDVLHRRHCPHQRLYPQQQLLCHKGAKALLAIGELDPQSLSCTTSFITTAFLVSSYPANLLNMDSPYFLLLIHSWI